MPTTPTPSAAGGARTAGRRSLRVAAALSLIAALGAGQAVVQAARPPTASGCVLSPGDTTIVWDASLRQAVTLELEWFAAGTQIFSDSVPISRRMHFIYATPTPAGADEFGANFLNAAGDSLGVTGGACVP